MPVQQLFCWEKNICEQYLFIYITFVFASLDGLFVECHLERALLRILVYSPDQTMSNVLFQIKWNQLSCSKNKSSGRKKEERNTPGVILN